MSEQDTGPGEGAGAGAGGNGAGRGRGSLTAELGAELRSIRIDLTALAAAGRTTSGHVAEILPRLAGLEDTVARLSGVVDELRGAEPEDEADAPVPTPAMGWEDLTEQQTSAAWEALARWVGETLCRRYRISRERLPDCWPVHPPAVLELAWLRTLYLTAAKDAARNPAGVAEWHQRWLPTVVTNLQAVIDRRECGPGYHRLTEAERENHHHALIQHAMGRTAAPTLTSETGPERPRYLPDRFPPVERGKRHSDYTRAVDDPSQPVAPPRDPRPDARDAAVPLGPSSPARWLDFYRDAVAAALAARRAAAPAQDTATQDTAARDNAAQDGAPVTEL